METKPEFTDIYSVIAKFKMVNNASKLNAIYSIHGHTSENEYPRAAGLMQLFENTDPAFSWTFIVREIQMDKLPSDT